MVRKTLLKRIRESCKGIPDILKMIVDEVDELNERITKLERKHK